MPANQGIQTERREAIVRMLRSGPAPTQRAVVAKLREDGYAVTQSSISRDFQDLGVQKTAAGYQLPPAQADDNDDAISDAAGYIRSVASAGPNIVVIRTATGAAQRVCLAIDRTVWPEVVGTVSGDDTIFIASASQASTRNLIRRLELIGQGRN